MVIADHGNMTFAASFILMFILVPTPMIISYFLLKIKAPFMSLFSFHHPYVCYFQAGACLIISFFVYVAVTSHWPRQNSFGQLAAAFVFSTPIVIFIDLMLSFNKQYQDWAMKEMRGLVGEEVSRPHTRPSDWKISGEAGEPSQLEKFDPERFKGPKP